jgi:DivIVA domain-containing protein
MLPPHELKNKTFSRVLRGYNSVEVDEHINFIIDKYTELYRQNDELERRLKLAEAKLAEFRADEESIRSALVNAQKASAKIISEANERADVIMRSARTNCNKVITSFKSELKKEREELLALRRAVSEFKARLFTLYQQHIAYIEEISPDDEISDADTPDDVFVRRVVEQVKSDIAQGKIPPSSSDGKVNTDAEDEPIISVYGTLENKEENPQTSFREITRSKSAVQSQENTPEEHEPVQDEANPKAEPVAAADESAPAEDDEDGGGYLDDADFDAPETDTVEAAEIEPDIPNEPDDPDALLDSIKPGARPSTITAEPQKKSGDSFETPRNGQRQTSQNSYRSASVKETIRELNKKFSFGDSADSQAEQSTKQTEGYTPDAEDKELLSMIRSVTGEAEEKDKGSKNKKKGKTKPLTLTEEFDLISDDENPTD